MIQPRRLNVALAGDGHVIVRDDRGREQGRGTLRPSSQSGYVSFDFESGVLEGHTLRVPVIPIAELAGWKAPE